MTVCGSEFPCSFTTTVSFPSGRFCSMAHKLLKSEENTHKDVSEVLYKCEGHILNVVITAANTRTLRLKVNAFYETCYLVSSILEEFISFVQS